LVYVQYIICVKDVYTKSNVQCSWIDNGYVKVIKSSEAYAID